MSGCYRQDATHSGILTSGRSTSPSDLASLLQNAPLPSHGVNAIHRVHADTINAVPTDEIHGFGMMLEPRYVVGAFALDQ